MAMYCCMHIEKHKRTAVYGVQIEATRTPEDHYVKGRDFPKSNIDWSRTDTNIFLVRSESWHKAISEDLKTAGIKEHKNNVVLVDGVYSASHDWFEGKSEAEIRKYFEDCLEYHIREFCGGDRSLVVSAVIHLDEKTPHCHICSTPILEDERGKHLTAKRIIGNRGDLRKQQDHFYEQVGKPRGLARGEVRDPAEIKKHTTKNEWLIATQEEKLQRLKKQIVYNRALSEIDPSDLVRYLYKKDPALLIEAVRQTKPEVFQRICREEDYQEDLDRDFER